MRTPAVQKQRQRWEKCQNDSVQMKEALQVEEVRLVTHMMSRKTPKGFLYCVLSTMFFILSQIKSPVFKFQNNKNRFCTVKKK